MQERKKMKTEKKKYLANRQGRKYLISKIWKIPILLRRKDTCPYPKQENNEEMIAMSWVYQAHKFRRKWMEISDLSLREE